ncbi:MAG: fatty acid desaturase [Sphingomonadales bacterium]|nr:fatty acid desaturase [Sphingomonadales bacterium]
MSEAGLIEGVVGATADRPALLLGPDGLDRHTRRDLRKEEIAIAARFQGEGGWPYAIWAVGGFAVWLGMFALAFLHRLNLPVALVYSSVYAGLGYIVAHDAIHHNIFRQDSRWHWLNELSGWLAVLPIVFPFPLARIVHLRHHTHVNDPLEDPDYSDDARNVWHAIWKTWWNRQPGVKGSIHAYKEAAYKIGTPEAMQALKITLVAQLLFMAALFAMAWSGFALEAVCLWWLPRHLGLTYARIYLSWAPHHPREGNTGRYNNSVIFTSMWGDVGSSFMAYHLLHHLYPRIPVHQTRPAFYAMRHILEARGVDVSSRPVKGR